MASNRHPAMGTLRAMQIEYSVCAPPASARNVLDVLWASDGLLSQSEVVKVTVGFSPEMRSLILAHQRSRRYRNETDASFIEAA
jgi:hypothetical protein